VIFTRFLQVLFFSLLLAFCEESSATSEAQHELQFQEGVKAYNSDDFLNCAIKMESFKDIISKFSQESKSKINFYRAICNGKLGYYGYVLPLIKEISFSDLSNDQVTMIESFQKEMQAQILKIGLVAAKSNDYLKCATQMELIKDPSDLFEDKIKNKILFYRAYCNAKIGYNVFSAGLLEDVSSEVLAGNEMKMYTELIKLLSKELEARKKIYTYFTLYGGSLSYSPKITKSKASLYGISTSFIPSLGGWDFNISVDQATFTLVDSSENYTQTQANVSFGKNFLTNFSIRPFFTNISTSNSAEASGGNEGRVMGVMGSYINSLTSKINLEYGYSVYPSFIIGKTTAREYVISWDKTLSTSTDYTIASKLLVEIIHPESTNSNTDPSTGFVLKSHYERIALDLNFYIPSWEFGLSGWTGAEALGTRNQGTIVFNALEERSRGLGATVKYDITPSSTSLKFSYASETILKPYSIKSSTLVGALTFIF
jgi:hypothetical protein